MKLFNKLISFFKKDKQENNNNINDNDNINKEIGLYWGINENNILNLEKEDKLTYQQLLKLHLDINDLFINTKTNNKNNSNRKITNDSISQYDNLASNYAINNTYSNIIDYNILKDYIYDSRFIGYQLCSILSQNEIINNCCTFPVQDALTSDFDVVSLDKNNINEILTEIKYLNFNNYIDCNLTTHKLKENLLNFSSDVRIFGVGYIIPAIKNTKLYEKHFNIDNIKNNEYLGMKVLPPLWVFPEIPNFNTNNIIDFNEPEYYYFTGFGYNIKIHKSWIIKNIYKSIPAELKAKYLYGGISLTQLLYKEVFYYRKEMIEIYNLMKSKRLFILDIQTENLWSDPDIEKLEKRIKKTISIVRNNDVYIKDKDSQFAQMQVDMKDIPETIRTSRLDICSISEIPEPRLFQTEPKGFNTTGQNETLRYKDLLKRIQNTEFKQIILKHYELILKSKYNISSNLDCYFEGSEIDKKQKLDAIIELYKTGILTKDDLYNIIKKENILNI